MKNILRGFFFILFYLFVWCMILIPFIASFYTDSDNTENMKLADGFTIEAYNIILNVEEDNKVFVEEDITVDWNEDYHHGMYKFTPEWLEYTGKDGKTINRKSKVSNFMAINETYSTDWVKKKARIKIGDASEYVPLGEKTYKITYNYDMGTDPFKNFDEFIFHAYGDYWGTEIKNASLQVNMPKSIEGYNINFFTDKKRNHNVSNFVDYHIEENTLYAKFNAEKYREYQYRNYCSNEYHLNEDGTCDDYYFDNYYIPLKKSLTVDIELPDHYFKKGSWNYGIGSLIVSFIIFALTILTIYKWIKFGKDHAKKAQTVEFYPPDDLNAAEIGYVFNKWQASKKLTISLIVQLASKGYIKIDDLKDKDKNIQITNLVMRKPVELKSIDDMCLQRTIEVKKLKDADDNLSISEVTMMVHLFKNGDTKLLQANIDKFLSVRDKLVRDGYIEVLSDNESEISMKASEKKAIYEEQVKQYNADMKKYNDIIAKQPILTSMEKIVYDKLFEDKDIIILSEHKTLYRAFDDIEYELRNSFKDKVHDQKANNKFLGAIFRTIIIVILNIISYKFIEDLDPNLKIFYILSFICIFINLFFTIFMKRKTEYGEVITARVKGFRHFLVTVEKPKLEALVAENPDYFYNILPYTYAMNISKKWIKKFENIPMPKMDMGTFEFGRDSSYSPFYNDVYYPKSVHTSSGSSGCSSCGGGCSSCGGGCSSCGGGGSW